MEGNKTLTQQAKVIRGILADLAADENVSITEGGISINMQQIGELHLGHIEEGYDQRLIRIMHDTDSPVLRNIINRLYVLATLLTNTPTQAAKMLGIERTTYSEHMKRRLPQLVGPFDVRDAKDMGSV